MNTITRATAHRSVAVMRMHLSDRITLVVMPTALLASVLVVNLAVWAFVPADGRQTGGAGSIWIFMLAAAVLAVVRGLPFALGMGVSRHAFVLGTALTGAVLAAGYGTLMLLLQVVERATHGWGMGGRFVWYGFFRRAPWPVDWLVLVVSIFAAFAVGELLASTWSRWGIWALVAGGPAAILAVGGVAVLITWREWWHDIGSWCADLTPAALLGWCALLAVVLSVATGGVLRRVRAG